MFTFGNFFLENPKYFFAPIERSFDNPAEKFLLEVWKLLAQSPKTIYELIYFFDESSHPKVFWTRRMQFWQPCWKICCSKSGRNSKVLGFSKNKLKIFLWTRRKEFREYQILYNIVLSVLRAGPSYPRMPMFDLEFFNHFILEPFLTHYRREIS